MSKNLKDCFRDLEFVSKIKCVKTRQQLLKYLSHNPKVYLALKEIAANLIKGNIDIHPKHKSKLRKHKKDICSLANQKYKILAKKRKKLVVQNGGWLWAIPIIASAIIDLIK